jgi:hypothetical protein
MHQEYVIRAMGRCGQLRDAYLPVAVGEDFDVGVLAEAAYGYRGYRLANKDLGPGSVTGTFT